MRRAPANLARAPSMAKLKGFIKARGRLLIAAENDPPMQFGYREKATDYAAGCIRTLTALMSRAGVSPNMRPYSRVNWGMLSYPTA